jgi:hypothetical protein
MGCMFHHAIIAFNQPLQFDTSHVQRKGHALDFRWRASAFSWSAAAVGQWGTQRVEVMTIFFGTKLLESIFID